MKRNIIAIFGIALMVFVAAACSRSPATPKISNLAFGKNEKADPVVTTFDIHDGIIAVATVSNANSKLSVNFIVTCEDVAGKEKGGNVMNKLTDVQDDRPVSLHFSVADPGEYRIEAALSDDTGKQIDSRSGIVTVTGEPLPLESEEKDRDRDIDKDSDKDRDRDKDKRRKIH